MTLYSQQSSLKFMMCCFQCLLIVINYLQSVDRWFKVIVHKSGSNQLTSLCEASYGSRQRDTLAFAAARRAAARLLLTAGRAAIDRYLLTAGPTAANRSSGVRRPDGTDGQTDGRTDIDPALHTMRAVSNTLLL